MIERGCYVQHFRINSVQNFFSLSDSRAVIPESPDLHLEKGSSLKLSCSVLEPSASPTFVYWYRDDTVLNYSPAVEITENLNLRQFSSTEQQQQQQPDDMVVASTSMGKMAKARLPTVNELQRVGVGGDKKAVEDGGDRDDKDDNDEGIVTTLSIDNVNRFHSGNYTCAPSNARQVSIMVHVVDGEFSAARVGQVGS